MSDDAVDTVDIKEIEESLNSFLYFTVDAVDIKKIIYLPIFFLYFAIDAIDILKTWWVTEKLKSY